MQPFFLNWDFVSQILKEASIPCVPTFFQGSLEECLEFKIANVDSIVPSTFGYPLIANNQIEGMMTMMII